MINDIVICERARHLFVGVLVEIRIGAFSVMMRVNAVSYGAFGVVVFCAFGEDVINWIRLAGLRGMTALR